MSKVYFIKENYEKGIKKAYSFLSKNLTKDKITIKLHFGEKGCTTFLNPNLIKYLIKSIKQNFVLTDCNALYRGSRTNESDHIQTAKDHGFNFAPVKIADGTSGEDYFEVEINKKHFKKVKIGKLIQDYKNIIVFSHFKGHIATGFGGAIKNLGMGLGSRAGKLAMHSHISPRIDSSKCILCNKCIENCPANAIEFVNNKNIINKNICIGCAKCIAVCPQKAVSIPWGSATSEELQERIAEYCYGIIQNRNLIYFNALINITRDCDCMGSVQKPFVKDIGILASSDLVSIDQASLDLVNKTSRSKNKFQEFHQVSGLTQLEYAEKLNLGSRKYELIKI